MSLVDISRPAQCKQLQKKSHENCREVHVDLYFCKAELDLESYLLAAPGQVEMFVASGYHVLGLRMMRLNALEGMTVGYVSSSPPHELT
jgi:hypothetical protein